MSDPKEIELRRKYLLAYQEYVNYKSPQYIKEFAQRIQELGIELPEQIPVPKEKTPSSEKCQEYYRKLSLRHHPDRPQGDTVIFQKIVQLYEDNEEDLLRKLCEDDFDSVFLNEIQLEIEKITFSYAWVWGEANLDRKKQTEQMFIDHMMLRKEIEIITLKEEL